MVFCEINYSSVFNQREKLLNFTWEPYKGKCNSFSFDRWKRSTNINSGWLLSNLIYINHFLRIWMVYLGCYCLEFVSPEIYLLYGILNSLLVGLTPCCLVTETEEVQSFQATPMKKLLCPYLYMNLYFDVLTMLWV